MHSRGGVPVDPRAARLDVDEPDAGRRAVRPRLSRRRRLIAARPVELVVGALFHRTQPRLKVAVPGQRDCKHHSGVKGEDTRKIGRASVNAFQRMFTSGKANDVQS